MKTKRTYHVPVTDTVVLNTDTILQDTLQDTFSGGDKNAGIVIDPEADTSGDDNRANGWTNHLWDE